MTDEQALATEQKTIIFYDDELSAVKLADGEIYVPVRRLCDNLGLNWPGQQQRINRDTVLSDAKRSVCITHTDPGKFTPAQSEMLCLPLDLIPGWLFGVQPSRVKEGIRPKLDRYRRECFRALWDAFKGDILPAAPTAVVMTPAEHALAQAEAIYNLARQQVALERWLAHHDQRLDVVEETTLAAHDRLDRAAEVVKALQLRVYGPHQVISEAQAAELAELVKGIAYRLAQRDPKETRAYQRVWGELHRRYNVTTYRRVPAAKFDEVVTWLEEWLASLGTEGEGAAAGKE